MPAPRESAPAAVKAAISAANSIATTPYVWGGGHGSWYSYGYDCSGAVSFALYGAGLLDTPLTSGSLESYGEPGPGRWITIYASATHTYMAIAGLRWDTVGDAQGRPARAGTLSPRIRKALSCGIRLGTELGHGAGCRGNCWCPSIRPFAQRGRAPGAAILV